MRWRRSALVVLLIGVAGIAIAQRLAPVAAPPLYDGVVVVDPYRWLVPPAGQQGDPQSASGTAQPDHGVSPLIAIATPESPPQAQAFAVPGAFVMPAGTTSVLLSITPVPPEALPTDGHITGNVYRIRIVTQAGVGLTAPASAKVSVVIRGPDGTVGATIEQYTGQAWLPLVTQDTGFAATYLAIVTGFGDFALVVPAPGGPSPTTTAQPIASSAASPSIEASAAPVAATPGPTGSGPVTSGADAGAGPPVLLVAAIGALAVIVIGARLLARRRRQPSQQFTRGNRWRR